MTHELYNRTLLGNEVVRLLNSRKASSNHRLHTINVNKKSLSGYDDKRFIMHDQVSTLPFGHKSIREDMFFWTIANKPDWGRKPGSWCRIDRSRRRVARSRRKIARSRRRVARSMHSNGANTTNTRKTSSKNDN